MNWRIDDSELPSFLRVSVEGRPTLPEYRLLWSELIGSDHWQPGIAVLKDIRRRGPLGAEGYDIVHAIAQLLTEKKDRVGNSLVAIVAAGDEGYHYGRVLEYAVRIRNSDMTIRTFGDEQAAIAWLDKSNHQ